MCLGLVRMPAPSCVLLLTPSTGTPLSFICKRMSRWSEVLTGDSPSSGTRSPKWNARGASRALTPSGNSMILHKVYWHGRSVYQIGTYQCRALLVHHCIYSITYLLTVQPKNVWLLTVIHLSILLLALSYMLLETTENNRNISCFLKLKPLLLKSNYILNRVWRKSINALWLKVFCSWLWSVILATTPDCDAQFCIVKNCIVEIVCNH